VSVGERFPLFLKIVVPSFSESSILLGLHGLEDDSKTVLPYIGISLLVDTLSKSK
jgi:hypothetical protein